MSLKHRSQRITRTARWLSPLALISALQLGCPSAPTQPSISGSYTISVQDAPIAVASGATSPSDAITIARTDFTSPITLSAVTEGGLTVAFTSQPGTGNNAALTVTVPAGLAPKTYHVTINGSATGSISASTTFAVNVYDPIPTYALSVQNTPITLAAGTTSPTDNITVTRTNFTDALTLSGTGESGITVNFTAQPGTGNTAAFTVNVPAGLAANTYHVTITGNPSLGVPATVVNVVVTTSTSFFTFAVQGQPLTATQGLSQPVVVLINRTNFTNPVTVTATSDAGIVITPSESPTPGNQTTLNVFVPPTASATAHTVTLTGTAVGINPVSTTFNVTVAAPTSAFITVSTNTPTTGTSVHFVANPVTTPAGATFAWNFGDAGTATGITADHAYAAAGTYTATVTMTSSTGVVLATSTIGITVTTPTTNTTYNFCSAAGLPVWVAVQDGAGPTWNRVTGTGGQYAFNITQGKGGIAWVAQNGTTQELHVFYGTQTEIAAQGSVSCAAGNTKLVNGTIANTGTAARVYSALGSSFKLAFLPATTVQWNSVAPGTVDLVATSTDGSTPPSPIKMLIRRNLTPADGSTLAAALDFSGTEAFAPQLSTVSLVNSLGQQVNLSLSLHTANNVLSNYYFDGSSSAATTRVVFGLPAANQISTDIHFIQFVANGSGSGAVATRTAGLFAKTIASLTATFGAALNTPVVTLPGAGVVRTTFGAVQSDYNKLFQVDFDQVSTGGKTAQVQMTAGYLGATPAAVLDLPNFTAVAGWLTSYGLTTGVSTPWRASAAGWSGLGITFPAPVDGGTYNAASVPGTITTP